MNARAAVAVEKPKSGLTIREAADMLGVGKDLLYRKYDKAASTINVGWTEMRVIAIGRRVVVPRAEVERVLCLREAS